MNGKNRKDIKPGLKVNITQKPDQRSGKLTSGIVKDVLTRSAYHPHGVKVRLETGEVGLNPTSLSPGAIRDYGPLRLEK
jgi:uncharacterized repeat protein (TIGR03833 family)